MGDISTLRLLEKSLVCLQGDSQYDEFLSSYLNLVVRDLGPVFELPNSLTVLKQDITSIQYHVDHHPQLNDYLVSLDMTLKSTSNVSYVMQFEEHEKELSIFIPSIVHDRIVEVWGARTGVYKTELRTDASAFQDPGLPGRAYRFSDISFLRNDAPNAPNAQVYHINNAADTQVVRGLGTGQITGEQYSMLQHAWIRYLNSVKVRP